MQAAIRAINLSRKFEELYAVEELSLDIAEGELFGLVGPDGAGKTTCMRLLSSILLPSSGEAWIADYHVVKDAEKVKRNIGYVSQRFGLYQDLSVSENIDFYADIYGISRRNRKNRVERLLDFTNLAPFKKRLAGALSGGMKQKLGLVCALVHTPKVLLLDEPTNGVDPLSRREFWHILYELLQEKVTIFVSTAYLDEAERCNRIGLMHKGKILLCDSPDNVRNSMKGSAIEVVIDKPRQAVDVLNSRLEKVYIGLFGDRIHILSESKEDITEIAKDLLINAGIQVTEIREITPSLEDVFVSSMAKLRED